MPFLAFETINKVSRSCKIPFGRKFRRDGSTPSPAAVQMVIFLEKHPSLRFQRMYHKVFLLLPSVLCGVLLSTPSGSRLGRNKVDADLVFLIVLPGRQHHGGCALRVLTEPAAKSVKINDFPEKL